jgi:hypothetical protein
MASQEGEKPAGQAVATGQPQPGYAQNLWICA